AVAYSIVRPSLQPSAALALVTNSSAARPANPNTSAGVRSQARRGRGAWGGTPRCGRVVAGSLLRRLGWVAWVSLRLLGIRVRLDCTGFGFQMQDACQVGAGWYAAQ